MNAAVTTHLAEGIFSRHAEEQLCRWIENQSPDHFTGWLGLHFTAPVGFSPGVSIWDNPDKLKQADLEIVEGPLKGELHLFLLKDYSIIAMMRNRSRLNMQEVQKHVVQVVYKISTSPSPKVYDLSIALSEFKNLCSQKYNAVQKNQKISAAPIAAGPVKKLDVSALQTSQFKALLATRGKRRQQVILLVEDDKVTAKLLGRLLKDYKPVFASSAVEALMLYSELAPSLCFLDIGLPDFSGLEVLEAIHKHDPSAFVVMLTANSSQDNLNEALHNGIRGFIAKPFTIAKVSQYLDKFKRD